MRAVHRLEVALVLGLALATAPGVVQPAAARLPTTPTVEFDKANDSRDMTLIFYVIPDNGLPRSVWISCDGGTTQSVLYPFADRILVSLDLPGCEGYGLKTVDVQVEDANGPIFWGQVTPGISPRLSVGRPLPAITGHDVHARAALSRRLHAAVRQPVSIRVPLGR